MKIDEMNFEIKEIDGVRNGKLVVFDGEILFSNTDKLTKYIEEKCVDDVENPVLVIDCTNLYFLDSTGTLGLFNLHQKLRKCNGDMKIFGLNPQITDVCDKLGVFKFIGGYKTYEDAVGSIHK